MFLFYLALDMFSREKKLNERHIFLFLLVVVCASSKLEDMGMHVLGDYNSPVIPAVIYVPAKLSAFSKECYERGLAVSADRCRGGFFQGRL